jgi:hypothetical protein
MLAFRLSAHLRNNLRSQIELPMDIHRQLHIEVPAMAVPEAPVARLALEHINTRPRQYKTLDVTRSLADELYDTSLGEHLALQLPFLILGTEALKRTVV